MVTRVNIDEAALRRMWADNISCDRIAKALGCGVNTVANRAIEWQLPPRGPIKRHPRPVVASPPAPAMQGKPAPVAPHPEALAMLRRVGTGAKAIGQVAARYGLGYGAVADMAAGV